MKNIFRFCQFAFLLMVAAPLGATTTTFLATNDLTGSVVVALYATNAVGQFTFTGSTTIAPGTSNAISGAGSAYAGVAVVNATVSAARVSIFSALANSAGANCSYLTTNGYGTYYTLAPGSGPGSISGGSAFTGGANGTVSGSASNSAPVNPVGATFFYVVTDPNGNVISPANFKGLTNTYSLTSFGAYGGNLYCWFDASSVVGLTNNATISSAVDLSGNNHTWTGNVFYAQDAVGGRPAFGYNGAGYYLTNLNFFTTSLATNLTMFVVWRNNQPANALSLMLSSGAGGSSQTYFSPYSSGANNGPGPAWSQTGNGIGFCSVADDAAPSQTSPQVMALKYDGVNPVLWLNERISWIQALYGSPLANVPFGTNDFSSGTISATSSWPFYGYIAEVIVYSNQLSQAQIESVNNYLCKKYNRKNQSIVLDGPSTIAGVTTSAYGNPAGVLKQVFRDWDIDVVAYSGATTARTTNTEPYWMNVLKPNKNIYIFNVANNDFSGLTTAQATTQMPATETNYINAYVNARNAGYLTLAMTTLSTYSETNGYVTNFNNWLLNNWSGFADGIIDSHLDTNLCGTAGAYMNAAYFSNGGSTNTGLHWTSVLVTNLVNNYMAPAIKKLVGGFIQPLSSSCYVLTTNLTSTNLMTATPFYVTATNNGTYTLTAHFSAMGAATTNYPSLDIETTSVVPAGLQASYWYQEMNVLTNGYYNALKDQAYPAVVISSASHLCLTYAPNFNYQAATIDLAIKEVITNAPVTFYAYVVDYDGSGSLNLLQTNTVSATSWLQLSQP